MDIAVPVSWIILGLAVPATALSIWELLWTGNHLHQAVDPEDRITARIDLRRAISLLAGCVAMVVGAVPTLSTQDPHVACQSYAIAFLILVLFRVGVGYLNVRDARLLRQLPLLIPEAEQSHDVAS